MVSDLPGEEISKTHLNDVVRKALDRPSLQVIDWKVQPLHGGVEWDSTVHRFQGQARDGGEMVPWSLILKAVKSAKKSIDPGGIWYWKREALAYQSGLLHHLPGGNVTAPSCYQVEERSEDSLWLWMEDIREDIQSPWSIEQYALAARQLGQFNGAYLAGQPCPSESWITRNWLRQYTEHAAAGIDFIHANPDHPIIRHMYPGNTLAQILAIWEERNQILGALDDLPQVFCHQDAFRRNLFSRHRQTVAIDWGYMGIAPVGAELVALVAGSLGFFEVPAERVRELDRLCFDGYLQGLREAGWNGDPKLVRTGYILSLMLRYPVSAQVGEMLPTFLDQERRSKLETAFENKSAAELEKADPAIVAYYESILPEGMKLLGMRRLLRLAGRIGILTLRLRSVRKK